MRGLHERLAARFRVDRDALLAASLFTGAANAALVAATAASLATAAWLQQSGAITLGGVYLVFRYTGMLRMPLERLSRHMNSFQQAMGGIVRVRELLATEPRIIDGAGADLPAGAWRSSSTPSTSPTTGSRCCGDVSCRVEPGRVLGLLGRTGSGKTTIARLLFRLYDVDGGAVRLGGVDVRDLRVDDLRRRVGLVTQDVQLFPGRCATTSRCSTPTSATSGSSTCSRRSGLDEWLPELPDGLDTALGPAARGPVGGRGAARRARPRVPRGSRARRARRGVVAARPAHRGAAGARHRPAARRPNRHRHRPPAAHDRAGRRGARPRGRTGRRARRPGWRSPPTPRRASPSCCAPGSRRCWHEARARPSSASRGATSPAARRSGPLLYCVAPLALGLATRAFFDRLPAKPPARVWVAVALVGAVQAGEVLGELAIGRTWSGFCYKTHTLLQRNPLAGILRGFGRSGCRSRPATRSAASGTSRPASRWARWTASPTSSAAALFAVVAAS